MGMEKVRDGSLDPEPGSYPENTGRAPFGVSFARIAGRSGARGLKNLRKGLESRGLAALGVRT